MKLTNLKLVNFQSHENTDIELSSGVNAFYGTTHSGKSSIIRALRWLFKNRPSSGMPSHWAGDTAVEIDTESIRIARHRTSQFNGYIVDDNSNGNYWEYQAVGSSVPDHIQQLFPLYDFNWKEQGEGHFLIGLSSGKVAQQLNRVVALDSIDCILSEISSRIRSNRQDMQRVGNDLQEAEQNVSCYDFLDDLKHEIDKLQKHDKVLGELNVLSNELRMRAEEAQEAESVVNDYEWVKEADELICKLERDVPRLKGLNDQIADLKRILGYAEYYSNRLNEFSVYQDLDEDATELEQLYDQLRQLAMFYNGLNGKLQEIQNTQNRCDTTSEKVTSLEKELREQFPDVCPFCGSRVEKHKNTV